MIGYTPQPNSFGITSLPTARPAGGPRFLGPPIHTTMPGVMPQVGMSDPLRNAVANPNMPRPNVFFPPHIVKAAMDYANQPRPVGGPRFLGPPIQAGGGSTPGYPVAPWLQKSNIQPPAALPPWVTAMRAWGQTHDGPRPQMPAQIQTPPFGGI